MSTAESTPYAFDPELAPFVSLLPEVSIADPVGARAEIAAFAEAGGFEANVDRTGLEISDHFVMRTNAPEVRVRVYRPEQTQTTRPALLYIHGGGFVIGSIEMEEHNTTALARELGIVVASVEYRLAPEDPFPAGLDDCEAALDWVHEQAEELSIDRNRVGVYGMSAGGGLAAALALRARDRGEPSIAFQFLGFPELDDRLDTPSMRRFVDTPMWNRPNAELSWRHYLANVDGEVPHEAAPARTLNLAGLPPAYVSAMEFDPLRDEAIDYATRLLQAGVPTELHVFPGTFHGSAFITDAAVSRRADEEAFVALRRGLDL